MRIAIVGAGACGIMLAIKLKELGVNYEIFNKGNVLRKVLASGNGKCNIYNNNAKLEDYFNTTLAYNVVSAHYQEFIDTLSKLDIYTKELSEGRMYPYSESSLSVVNILLENINNNITDLEVSSITEKNGKYFLNGNVGPFDYVVISTGSKASFRKGFEYKKPYSNLNINVINEKPALVGFKVKESIKAISGARAKVNVTLVNDNKPIYSEVGEMIFKDDGVSGICVMNLSSYYQRLENKNAYLLIDLASEIDVKNYKSVLTPKLYEYITKNNINPHKLKLTIKDTYDYEFAQVCYGGIDLNEVNNNLMLKKYKNIFVGGEALNVDARCGGYNLLFAFTSAIHIKEALKNEISGK